jgi:molybdopterin molybdotransferase
MKTIVEAQQIILEHTSRLGTEEIALSDSLRRVLAEDVFANRDHPPYDISAMDGYAVRADDLKEPAKDKPIVLKIIDDIVAGGEPKCSVTSGAASRIMTGAPMPEGADTVVRVEDTDCNKVEVKIFAPYKNGANVRYLAENLRTGVKVLSDATEIGPGELGILAMVKKATVLVYKRPRIAILSTGDELEALDEPFDERKIPDANSYTIMAELKAIGVEPVLLGIARDSEEELVAKLREGLGFDALIVSGGVSVGHHDFVRPTLKSLGIEMRFWRVALRPGHPFAFGTGKDGLLVFALPGNPVSSMVCCEQFIVPSARKMQGADKLFRATIKATLAEDIKDKKGRIHFMRSHLEKTADGFSVRLTGSQGSGILMSMVEATGLLVMPAEQDNLPAGTTVTVQLIGDSGFQKEAGF